MSQHQRQLTPAQHGQPDRPVEQIERRPQVSGHNSLPDDGQRFGPMTLDVQNKKEKENADAEGCCCWRGKFCVVMLLLLSLLFMSAAVFIQTQFEHIFRSVLKDQMHLGPKGFVFPAWRVSDLRMRMRVYLFNITNPEEVLLGHKPALKEMGPYTWRIYMDKLDIQFNPNYTLSYREKRWYEFLPQESVGGYKDIVTTVNVPFAAVAQRLKHSSTFAKSTATFTLNSLGQTVLHARTVGELTFEGYPDFLILVANAAESGRQQQESGLSTLLGASLRLFTNVLAAEPDVDASFGYFVGRNNTDDGVVTFFTGEDERSKINRVDVVAGRRQLDVWPSERCNRIEGTLGHMRPPMADPGRPLTLFVADLCRPLRLALEGVSRYGGLATLRYVAGGETFNNSAPNSCYGGPRHLKDGVMDFGPCKKGAPLVLSFPHYLYADESHLDSIIGLNPRKDAHEFYLESDAVTGITLAVRARFQIGVAMERVHGLGNLGTIFEGNIPLFWQELQLEALPPTVAKLTLLRNLPLYAVYFAYLLMVLGIIAALAALFRIYREWRGLRVVSMKSADVDSPKNAFTAQPVCYVNRPHSAYVYENEDALTKVDEDGKPFPSELGNSINRINLYNAINHGSQRGLQTGVHNGAISSFSSLEQNLPRRPSQ